MGPITSKYTGRPPATSIASSGEKKPTDLPVQAPTKYELVINLKTAKTLGIEIPTSIGRAMGEVIETVALGAESGATKALWPL